MTFAYFYLKVEGEKNPSKNRGKKSLRGKKERQKIIVVIIQDRSRKPLKSKYVEIKHLTDCVRILSKQSLEVKPEAIVRTNDVSDLEKYF